MKRWKLSDFETRNGRSPITEETLWRYAYEIKPCLGDLTADQIDKLALLLNTPSLREFYSSVVPAKNPPAELPTGLVIEKFNRACELLGILEDE